MSKNKHPARRLVEEVGGKAKVPAELIGEIKELVGAKSVTFSRYKNKGLDPNNPWLGCFVIEGVDNREWQKVWANGTDWPDHRDNENSDMSKWRRLAALVKKRAPCRQVTVYLDTVNKPLTTRGDEGRSTTFAYEVRAQVHMDHHSGTTNHLIYNGSRLARNG